MLAGEFMASMAPKTAAPSTQPKLEDIDAMDIDAVEPPFAPPPKNDANSKKAPIPIDDDDGDAELPEEEDKTISIPTQDRIEELKRRYSLHFLFFLSP